MESNMFCEDQETFYALNALRSTIGSRGRPLVVWLGAGASAWAGYPLWRDLAEQMHGRFAREVGTYVKETGVELLAAEAYPQTLSGDAHKRFGALFLLSTECFRVSSTDPHLWTNAACA